MVAAADGLKREMSELQVLREEVAEAERSSVRWPSTGRLATKQF
jgi:hypothetical protein